MTDLHAQIDLVEGTLAEPAVDGALGTMKRAFAVLRLTRDDATTGLGEASPLPGYSPDSMEDVLRELGRLCEAPLSVDALGGPRDVLQQAFSACPMTQPAARFALETALLDWLGNTRGRPVHRLLAVDKPPRGVPIADLVHAASPAQWPTEADQLVEDGATHVKLKVGADLGAEVSALETIRRRHPALCLRLDGNRRISAEALTEHAASLEALDLELFEEPVPPAQWQAALRLPLPYALDESLRDRALSVRLLRSGRIQAAVLKPTVLGGFTGALALADLAAAHGVPSLVTHTFDGPIARAACAELALVLGTPLAAGLGVHPALALWPAHQVAAISGRQIGPHGAPGLGLRFEGEPDA